MADPHESSVGRCRDCQLRAAVEVQKPGNFRSIATFRFVDSSTSGLFSKRTLSSAGAYRFLPEQGIDSLVPHFVMEFFATINCALTPAEDGGSGSFDVPDPPPCDYRSLYQTIIACVIVEHLMVIVKMSLSAFIPDKPSRIADDQFVEGYFAEKEMKQYDAMLHRQSNRYSAKKAAAEIEEASFRSETFVAGENE